MGSDLGFVEFVVDQIDPDCAVTYRKMFGEFGLYSHGTRSQTELPDQGRGRGRPVAL